MNVHAPIATEATRLRLTADDFDAMARAGVLDRFGKTELREGEIYRMSPATNRHGVVIVRLARRLDAAFEREESVTVAADVSVRVDDDEVPEPDIVVSRTPPIAEFVPVGDVVLLVEVAVTTLRDDIGRKARLYAAGGVPEYWVVDTEGARLIRFHAPGPTGYATHDQFPLGDVVTMATRPDIAIATDRLF